MIKTVTPIDNSIFVERNYASNTEVEDALENSLIAFSTVKSGSSI